MKKVASIDIGLEIHAAHEAGLSWARISAALNPGMPVVSVSTIRRLSKKASGKASRKPIGPLTKSMIAASLWPLIAPRLESGLSWTQVASELSRIGVNINVNTMKAAIYRNRIGGRHE